MSQDTPKNISPAAMPTRREQAIEDIAALALRTTSIENSVHSLSRIIQSYPGADLQMLADAMPHIDRGFVLLNKAVFATVTRLPEREVAPPPQVHEPVTDDLPVKAEEEPPEVQPRRKKAGPRRSPAATI